MKGPELKKPRLAWLFLFWVQRTLTAERARKGKVSLGAIHLRCVYK